MISRIKLNNNDSSQFIRARFLLKPLLQIETGDEAFILEAKMKKRNLIFISLTRSHCFRKITELKTYLYFHNFWLRGVAV